MINRAQMWMQSSRILLNLRHHGTMNEPEPPGRYIVMFKQTATQEQIDHIKQMVQSAGAVAGLKGDAVYNQFNMGPTYRGFAATITDMQELNNHLADDGPIDYIEPDGTVTTQ
ncbi:hypothetical protein FRC14_007422 [Serendipita sp. 396]|nr:hypothetical protein FRC14_007422 [Serendipita sp. 396]KAG8856085.1 hypothetical protein FRB91_001303 [Serendipita sp. 411]